MCGPLTPSPWTLHHSKLLSHTRKTSHLAPPTPLECLRKKRKRELKKEQIYMECDRMWNLRRFRWERHLPHIPKNVIPGHFSWKIKKRKKNTCRGGKKVKSRSPPEYEDFMVCDARSGVRWFLSMCGECDDTCVECDDTCGVRRSFSSALFFEYACLERPIETAKNSTPNPSPNLDRHISFFCILFHTMQNFTGQTILCTLSWNKVTYQNPGQEYDENLVCEDFLNMGMLPLDQLVFPVAPAAWAQRAAH